LLKERQEDIPLLANDFLQTANSNLNKKILGFAPAALKMLLNHEWSENIREMKHTIKRAVLVEETDYITCEALYSPVPHPHLDREHSIADFVSKIIDNGLSLHDIENDILFATERKLILAILRKVNYNKSKAVKLLGIDRNNLYNKINQLDIH